MSDSVTEPAPIQRSYKRSEEFWPATKAYQPRTGTSYHLYRLWPKIDRKLSGHEQSVLDVALEMDEQYILRTWGSGDYEVFFKDANQKGSQISKTIVKLDHPDFPPVVDKAELVVGHPSNTGFIEQLKARGLWEKADKVADTAAAEAVQQMGKIAADAMARANQPRHEDKALSKSMDIMGTAFETAAKRIADSSGKDGGENSLLMQLLLKRMDQQHETMLALIKDRRGDGAAPTVDSQITVVDKMMDFADRLNSRNGGGGGSTFMDSLMGKLPEMLWMFMNMMAMQQRAGGPAPVSSSLGLGAPGGFAPPPAPPSPAAAPPADFEVTAEMLARFGLPAEFLPLVKVIQRGIRAFSEGFSGGAFAESLDRSGEDAAYSQIAALGADQIIAILRSLPAALLGPDAAAAIHSPELEPWVAEFVAYGIEEAEPPAPAPSPVVTVMPRPDK